MAQFVRPMGKKIFIAADYVTGRFAVFDQLVSRFLYMFQSRFGIILQICIYISPAYIKSIFHPTSWSAPLKTPPLSRTIV